MEIFRINISRICFALQIQNALSAYLKSNQILPFCFTWRCCEAINHEFSDYHVILVIHFAILDIKKCNRIKKTVRIRLLKWHQRYHLLWTIRHFTDILCIDGLWCEKNALEMPCRTQSVNSPDWHHRAADDRAEQVIAVNLSSAVWTQGVRRVCREVSRAASCVNVTSLSLFKYPIKTGL